MIVLTNSKTLTAALAAAPTTQPTFITVYADVTDNSISEGMSEMIATGTTPVTLLAAPPAATRRVIKNIYCLNLDSQSITPTVSVNGFKALSSPIVAGGCVDLCNPNGSSSVFPSTILQEILFQNAGGQTFRQAANQDGIRIRGRAGGTGGFVFEIVPPTLTTSRTVAGQDKTGTMALRDPGTTDGIFDWSNPNVITGFATAIVGRVNVCIGTAADYTVPIPTPVGISGQTIAIEIDPACTRLITLSAAAGTLGGSATRVATARESFILRSNGSEWVRIGGSNRPMSLIMTRSAAQTITPTTWTQVVMDTANADSTSGVLASDIRFADMANGRCRILRSGYYQASAKAGFTAQLANGKGAAAGVSLNSPVPGSLGPGSYSYSGIDSISGQGLTHGNGSALMYCVAGGYICCTVLQDDTVNRNTSTGADAPFLSVVEVPSW